MRRKGEKHIPADRGYIVIINKYGLVLEYQDCAAEGGAQTALQALFDEYASLGWTLEGRHYDYQFANKGTERVYIGISFQHPSENVVNGILKQPPRRR